MLPAPGTSILHVGNFLSARGFNRTFAEELADRLEQAGWKVFRTSDAVARLVRLASIATTCWLRRQDYGVAHIDVFSGPAFIWAEVAACVVHVSGRPYVLTLHGGNLPSFARRWPRRVKRLLASATVVTTPSGYLREHMCPYRKDLLMLPNPLELRNYSYRWRERAQPSLLWLRAFHNIYNPSLAPEVLSMLVGDFPEIQLTMVGPDKGDGSLQSVRQAAVELGVSDRLALPGGIPRQAVPAWLAKGDIFLNTTDIDNTPISVIEAMGCGLCIVSTNVGGIPYLLENEHNALLVPPDDAEAMAAAVRRILTEPGLAARLSHNARKASEQFDWANVLPLWKTLITAVAQGHAR